LRAAEIANRFYAVKRLPTGEHVCLSNATCSVARGEVFKYPLFETIGQQHGKCAAQVDQRWILQKGVSVNTMSTRRGNIQANFTIDDFELTISEMAEIDQLTNTNYRIVNNSIVPWAPDFA
jgi:2,5-diketo-D-gluconate reductase B